MALAGSVVAAIVVAPVQAQDQDQDDSSYMIEEVIVTSQKREQSLQDVAPHDRNIKPAPTNLRNVHLNEGLQ